MRALIVVPIVLGAVTTTASSACPPACETLKQRVNGTFTCDVTSYDYSWGNKICQGILPICVLRPEGARDIAEAVKVSRDTKVALSYRSGGHSYTCNSIKEGSIHIDLRSLDSVSVHPSKTAGFNGTEISFGTGLVMRQLIDALGPRQSIVHGQCPTVGAGGLFLHGGLHTTLSLDYGRGNDTVTSMEVVTADGSVLELNDTSAHRELWVAMRQAGSSFAIATRITAKVIDDLPPNRVPSDGGMFFALDTPREQLLALMDNASHERPGLPNYIHVNGIDFLIASASHKYDENAAWVEAALGRKLTLKESMRSRMVAALQQPVSDDAGADKKFGSSGAVPYIFSTQEAYADVSFIMPLECYQLPKMRTLLAAVPDFRDNSTDLGCYFQVSTTYAEGLAFIDYNCPYDSPAYQHRQRTLNSRVMQLCPVGIRRYINTPSVFLTPRDYFANYDELAAIKSTYDPDEIFRVYQGIRPTGLAPDAYEWKREGYVRTKTAKDKLGELGWDALKKFHIL